MASVTFSHVYKSYSATDPVLRDLCLEIRDRECMVLVGPSGSGKTTALKMVAGLETVTSGEIRIGDRVINEVRPRDRDVAMVFQSYALYPHMSVFMNMAYPLKVRRTPRSTIVARVTEAAQVLGLDALLTRRPRALSGGQMQRVALGRAIVRDPKVFLLDEPLSNLDAKLRSQTRIELQKLHRRLGTTFLYVTHDQVEAMTMGDRIAVVNRGELQQVATPSDLYAYPANVFVAAFIGSPAMNLIPATVRHVTARASAFELPIPRPLPEGRVILGIRPEALTAAAGDDVVAEMRVEVVERLGSDQYLYGRVGEDSLCVRVDPKMRVDIGDLVRLGVDAGAIHVFDPETQLRLI